MIFVEDKGIKHQMLQSQDREHITQKHQYMFHEIILLQAFAVPWFLGFSFSDISISRALLTFHPHSTEKASKHNILHTFLNHKRSLKRKGKHS